MRCSVRLNERPVRRRHERSRRLSSRESSDTTGAAHRFGDSPSAHVLGELFAGAFASERAAENLDAIARLAAMWPMLAPDSETARVYGRIRADDRRQRAAWTEPARNDFWIAAVCLQHSVPLLSNEDL